MNAFETLCKAVELDRQSAAKSNAEIRKALVIFAAALAKQPSIDAKKLLVDFDALIEKNLAPEEEPATAMLDVRAVIAKVADIK